MDSEKEETQIQTEIKEPSIKRKRKSTHKIVQKRKSQMSSFSPVSRSKALIYHTVMIDDKNGEKVALIDKHDPIGNREHANLVERHQKRLREINDINIGFGHSFSMNQKKPGEQDHRGKRQLHQQINFEFRKQEEQRQIEIDNQRILNQLVRISVGKKAMIKYTRQSRSITNLSPDQSQMMEEMETQSQGETKNDPMDIQKQNSSRFASKRGTEVIKKKGPNTLQNIKSLHISQRKNELDRIEKANLKMAQKIYLAESTLKQEPKHGIKHKYWGDNLSKIKRRQVVDLKGGKTLHLPPIKVTEKGQLVQNFNKTAKNIGKKKSLGLDNIEEKPSLKETALDLDDPEQVDAEPEKLEIEQKKKKFLKYKKRKFARNKSARVSPSPVKNTSPVTAKDLENEEQELPDINKKTITSVTPLKHRKYDIHNISELEFIHLKKSQSPYNTEVPLEKLKKVKAQINKKYYKHAGAKLRKERKSIFETNNQSNIEETKEIEKHEELQN